jgi:hypothetical protein
MWSSLPFVQLVGRGEVGAEGLLGDHPGVAAEAQLADLTDRSLRRFRRQREVDEEVGVAAKFLLGGFDRLAEGPETVADADEAERLAEVIPGVIDA